MKHLLTLTAISILGFQTQPYAATFECQTAKALQWNNGELEPYPLFANTTFRFDEEDSTLWIKQNPDDERSGDIPFKMKIITHSGSYRELKATGESTANGDHLQGTMFFRLREYKLDASSKKQPAKPYFLFYQDTSNALSIGTCEKQ